MLVHGVSSDDFGQIPNLRPFLDQSHAFTTLNSSLTRLDSKAVTINDPYELSSPEKAIFLYGSEP